MLFCEAFIQESSYAFYSIAGGCLFAVAVENSKEGEAMFFQLNFSGIGVSKTPEDLGAVPKSRSGWLETQLRQTMQGGVSPKSSCRNLNHYRSHTTFPKLV